MESLAIDSSYRPTKTLERIQSLDIMRGLVLLGILIININGFGLYESYSDPTVAGEYTGLNRITWYVASLFFEGTMRALFSLLFGVGMFIFLERLESKGAGIGAADIYFRRLIWLLIMGIFRGYLFLWPGEILFDYAIMVFLVFPFRNLQPKKLFLIAGFLISIGLIWSYFDYRGAAHVWEDHLKIEQLKSDNQPIPDELKGSEESFQRYLDKHDPEKIQEYNEAHNKGYFQVLGLLAPENMEGEMYFFYRYNVWDILSMMLIGIGIFKMGILSADKNSKIYVLLAIIGYAVGLSINYLELNNILYNNFSYISFAESNITYDLGRLFLSMGHVGAIMLFCQSLWFQSFKRRIASVGQMALTNYFMHSAICIVLFTGTGFSLFGKLQRYELLYIVLGIWILQLIVSPIWLKFYYYGPLEWAWRCLSYQKMFPLKKPQLPLATA